MRTYCIAPTVYCIGTVRVFCGDLKGKDIQTGGGVVVVDICKYTANSLLYGDASGKESALQCRTLLTEGLFTVSILPLTHFPIFYYIFVSLFYLGYFSLS